MDCVVTVVPIGDPARGQTGCDAIPSPLLPTLGEILDAIAAERPDWRMTCEPALRGRRVGQVRVEVG